MPFAFIQQQLDLLYERLRVRISESNQTQLSVSTYVYSSSIYFLMKPSYASGSRKSKDHPWVAKFLRRHASSDKARASGL